MNLDEIKIFKAELKLLTVLERQYTIALQDIEYINYQMRGVRGIDPSKEPHHGEFVEMKNVLIPIKEIKERKADEYKKRIDACYYLLGLCSEEMQGILMDIYVTGIPTAEVAEKHYMSESTLKRRIIEQLLNLKTTIN